MLKSGRIVLILAVLMLIFPALALEKLTSEHFDVFFQIDPKLDRYSPGQKLNIKMEILPKKSEYRTLLAGEEGNPRTYYFQTDLEQTSWRLAIDYYQGGVWDEERRGKNVSIEAKYFAIGGEEKGISKLTVDLTGTVPDCNLSLCEFVAISSTCEQCELNALPSLKIIARSSTLGTPIVKVTTSPTPTTPSSLTAIPTVQSKLHVYSSPSNASIYINETYYGRTPAEIELTPGTYDIKVIYQGYQDYRINTTLYPGEDKYLNITLYPVQDSPTTQSSTFESSDSTGIFLLTILILCVLVFTWVFLFFMILKGKYFLSPDEVSWLIILLLIISIFLIASVFLLVVSPLSIADFLDLPLSVFIALLLTFLMLLIFFLTFLISDLLPKYIKYRWTKPEKSPDSATKKPMEKSKIVTIEKPMEKLTEKLKDFPLPLTEKYEPLEFLGEGGFAKVFKAKRKSDGEIVAIKIPRLDEKTSSIFLKEIASWYHLNHPNIVRLYSADILPVPYMEMEYVEGVEISGKTVRDLERYPKPVNEDIALSIVKGIADGLKHAHDKGIYHLDLKPLNVLIESDLMPKITDWGLAKISARSSPAASTGYSPLYAAPEQIDEKKFGQPDHRTDIYGLGVILYELLTGKLPYEAMTPSAVLGKIVAENIKPDPVSKHNPALAKFDRIIEKLLAKRKEDRFQSVDEFLSALDSMKSYKMELEELKKSLEDTKISLKKSRSKEEMDKLQKEAVEKTAKIAILAARLNDKPEVLNALEELKLFTKQNLEDLLGAISSVELMIKEEIPIGDEFIERLRVLLSRIKREFKVGE
ncbi:MAG: protein kinase [Archaeoglobaceae archaeon]